MPTLILAGGGLKGLSMLGAIYALIEEGNEYQQVVGTSIGSALGLLICVGWEPLFVIHYLYQQKIFDNLSFEPSLTQLMDFQRILTTIANMVTTKTGQPDITFTELEGKFHKELFCITTNYLTTQTEVMCTQTTPNLSCLEAIRRSCAIPYIFGRCVSELPTPALYIDGGFLQNFPVRVAVERCSPPYVGIIPEWTCNTSIDDSIFKVVFNAVSIILNASSENLIEIYKDKVNIYYVPYPFELSKTKFRLNELLDAFSAGYRAVTESNKDGIVSPIQPTTD